jgi:heme/copper-type cytochrome/quinol oxidase subunit 3
MVCVLALAVFVLRDGLRIRNGRLARRPVDSRRHRRVARVVVILAIAGFGSGLASMAFLRGKPLFESVHVWLASGALLGFAAGGTLGLALERRGRAPLRNWHALTASLGLLFGLAAAVAGLAILP